MLMFFTSGTTGYPKIAVHSYKCAGSTLRRYWHWVQPGGLHFTISETGWGKALWGKLYGQWLCEGAVFVYDFDRFDAEKILPMFAKYNITTFCAPPTMVPDADQAGSVPLRPQFHPARNDRGRGAEPGGLLSV